MIARYGSHTVTAYCQETSSQIAATRYTKVCFGWSTSGTGPRNGVACGLHLGPLHFLTKEDWIAKSTKLNIKPQFAILMEVVGSDSKVLHSSRSPSNLKLFWRKASFLFSQFWNKSCTVRAWMCWNFLVEQLRDYTPRFASMILSMRWSLLHHSPKRPIVTWIHLFLVFQPEIPKHTSSSRLMKPSQWRCSSTKWPIRTFGKMQRWRTAFSTLAQANCLTSQWNGEIVCPKNYEFRTA